jgi:hypothetical protein
MFKVWSENAPDAVEIVPLDRLHEHTSIDDQLRASPRRTG